MQMLYNERICYVLSKMEKKHEKLFWRFDDRKKFSKYSLAIECNTRNVIEFGIFLVEKKNFNIEKKRKYFGQVWEGEMCPQCVTHEQPKWKKTFNAL